ncbi:uncharacterized protein LOC109085573 [Cyprinus carpio]|uniref:Uncharacterized protein LOC109085573 n=1 Tax=Cyprinus carpio TaxID=7962 RepID=A0A9R0BGR5_CYPCA|nr:uncharacterized protein LOC109085573 [Cyprinus carpio]
MLRSYTDMKKHTDFGDSFWSFGKEQDFKPHIRHVEPVLTECDLDWKSHLRWIPEPRYSDAPFPHIKDIKFPNERKLMRSFPQANRVSASEWSFYPNIGQPKTYHTGKRCFMDGIMHTRSMRCFSENSLESSIGRKKQVCCMIYPLTKVRPFLVPEYSSDFHKMNHHCAQPLLGKDQHAYCRCSKIDQKDGTVAMFYCKLLNIKTPFVPLVKGYIKVGLQCFKSRHIIFLTYLLVYYFRSKPFATFKPFIHLKPSTKNVSPLYAEKHKSLAREEDILEVKSLNSWRPAPDIYDRTVLLDT